MPFVDFRDLVVDPPDIASEASHTIADTSNRPFRCTSPPPQSLVTAHLTVAPKSLSLRPTPVLMSPDALPDARHAYARTPRRPTHPSPPLPTLTSRPTPPKIFSAREKAAAAARGGEEGKEKKREEGEGKGEGRGREKKSPRASPPPQIAGVGRGHVTGVG